MTRCCIIGTGFSGTCMLWHFVKALCQTPPNNDLSAVEIFTVEQRRINGPGLPYDADDIEAHHLCNNPAEKMALFDNDFVDWMHANRQQLIHCHPDLIRAAHPMMPLDLWCPQPTTFYPRALFGLYLSQRFSEACTLAKSRGIRVQNFNCYEVIDGWSAPAQDGKFTLTIREIATHQERLIKQLDKVLLASGHWKTATQSHANILPSPYPSQHIRQAVAALQASPPPQARAVFAVFVVFVNGMGPSAVDAILTLFESGRFELDADGLASRFIPCHDTSELAELHVIAGSRSGFFPGVRWPLVDYQFAYLTDKHIAKLRQQAGRIDLTALLTLIDCELRAAGGNDLNLEAIRRPRLNNAYAKLLIDVEGALPERLAYTIMLRARRLRFYEDLRAADKRIYDTDLDTHFIRTAVPIPLPNAKKLIALIEAGVLSTVALGYQGHQKNHRGVAEIDTEAGMVKPDLVIFSNGQNYDLDQHPSPLIRCLIKRREVVVHAEENYRPGGISASEANQFRVLNHLGESPAYSTTLYSFGRITQYWQNQNNFAAAFVAAAEAVAKEWMTSVRLHSRSASSTEKMSDTVTCTESLIDQHNA